MSTRHLARIFVAYTESDVPERLIGLALDNHVTHVTTLVRQWDNQRAYGETVAGLLDETRPWLVRAAQRHDEAKPQTFRVHKSWNPRTRRYEATYSFRGHRFLVTDAERYVDWLIRLHHEYDVATITEAQADIRRYYTEQTGAVPLCSDRLAEAFPYDLYTLEMCDQIDAEASSYALSGNSDDADRERPFMEYHSRLDGEDVLRLDPWPFQGDDIILDYPSFTIDLTETCRQEFKRAKNDAALTTWKQIATEGEPVQDQAAVQMTLRPEEWTQRQCHGGGTKRSFYGGIAAHIPTPNPMQEAVLAGLKDGTFGGFLLLKGPTGSGKTEAVLAPVLEAGRRLFLILPSRSLVQDQEQRLSSYLQTASRHGQRTSLIIDTGERSERTVWWNGQPRPGTKRRHLYDADVVITTLDAFLYRFFAFGAGNKSYIFPLRIQLQPAMNPPLFCFDEAHSYDALAWQNFLSLLEALACDMGADVVVMSATMPADAQQQIAALGAQVCDFVADENGQRLAAYHRARGERLYPQIQLHYVPCADEQVVERITAVALDQWAPGRRVIVALESVGNAIAVYNNLRDTVGDGSNALFLYHGRLDANDRHRRYKAIAERDTADDGQGYLLVTTSAIEVGCDLDAHTLITQFCYPEQLVQRAGRCNRRGRHRDAALYVVGSALAPYASSLPRAARERLERDLAATLQQQHGGPFVATDLIGLIRPDLSVDDRAEVLFSLLYDYVYHGDRTAKPAHDKGLVLTRSWEPSIVLVQEKSTGRANGHDMHGRDDSQDKEPLVEHAVQVPLSRCIAQTEDQIAPNVVLYREVYDEDKRRMVKKPLDYGGCCYLHCLVAVVPEGSYDPVTGYADLPRFLRPAGSNGYRRSVRYRAPGTGKEITLWYLEKRASMEGDTEEIESVGTNGEEDAAGISESDRTEGEG